MFGNEVPRLRIHVLPRDLHGNVRPVVSDTYVAKLDRGAPGIETLAACELNTDWSEVHRTAQSIAVAVGVVVVGVFIVDGCCWGCCWGFYR